MYHDPNGLRNFWVYTTMDETDPAIWRSDLLGTLNLRNYDSTGEMHVAVRDLIQERYN